MGEARRGAALGPWVLWGFAGAHLLGRPWLAESVLGWLSAALALVFLPGLFLTLPYRARGLLVWVLVPLLSLALSGGAFAGALLAGLDPGPAAALVSLLALGLGALWARRAGSEGLFGAAGAPRGFFLAAALFALAVGLPYLAPRVGVSWHGLFHTASMERILSGELPPTNPGLVGEALNYGWGFHVLGALLSEAAGVHPLRAVAGFHVMWVFFTLLAVHELARPFVRGARARVVAAFATFGALNTAAPAILLAKRLYYGEVPGNAFTDGRWIDWLAQRAIPGNEWDIKRALWDVRASSFVKEFLDTNTLASGLYAFVTLLALLAARLAPCLPSAQPAAAGSDAAWRRFLERVLGLASFLVVVLYLPLAPVGAMIVGWAVLFLFAGGTPAQAAPWKRALGLALPAGLGFVAAVPYALAVTSKAGWSATGEAFARLAWPSSPWTLPAAFGLLAPACARGFLRGGRGAGQARPWFWAVTASLLLLTFFVDLQQATEYKYLYALCPLLAVGTVLGLEGGSGALSARRAWVAGLVFLGPPAVFLTGALTSEQMHEASYAFHGRELERRTSADEAACLAFLRDESPRDAVLVLPLTGDHKSPSNAAYEASALSRRAVWVSEDPYLARRFAVFDERLELTEALCAGERVGESTERLRAAWDTPLYLLLESAVWERAQPRYEAAGWSLATRAGGSALLRLAP